MQRCVHYLETERLRNRVEELIREVSQLRRRSPWENANCDGCGQPRLYMEGPRLRCTTCPDKDFCVECLKRGRICGHAYVVQYGAATESVPLGGLGLDVTGRAL